MHALVEERVLRGEVVKAARRSNAFMDILPAVCFRGWEACFLRIAHVSSHLLVKNVSRQNTRWPTTY